MIVAICGAIILFGVLLWKFMEYRSENFSRVFVMPEREVWIELLKRVEKLEKIVIKSKKIKKGQVRVVD